MMNWEEINIAKVDIKNLTRCKELEQDMLRENVEYTKKQISNSTHIRCLGKGFQVEYESDKIETFFAYFRTKKMTCFQGSLPFGVNKNWTLRTATVFLGQPSVKSPQIVEIIYEHLGLGLIFQGHWANDQSQIQYCYFFDSGKNQKLCSVCKKTVASSSNLNCSCGYVQYCSEICKNKHYGLHNIICCQQIIE